LDINIIDSLLYIYLRLRYVVAKNIVVLNNNLILLYQTPLSTAPPLSLELSMKMQRHGNSLILKSRGIRAQARIFEIIGGAMDRDRTDNRHGSLSDAFQSHIDSCREEFNAMGAEHKLCMLYSY